MIIVEQHMESMLQMYEDQSLTELVDKGQKVINRLIIAQNKKRTNTQKDASNKKPLPYRQWIGGEKRNIHGR
jgi:hypothetical protein